MNTIFRYTDIVHDAEEHILTKKEKVTRIIASVLTRIELDSNHFQSFVDVLKNDDDLLADILWRYYCECGYYSYVLCMKGWWQIVYMSLAVPTTEPKSNETLKYSKFTIADRCRVIITYKKRL